jgi:hypothetical protein
MKMTMTMKANGGGPSHGQEARHEDEKKTEEEQVTKTTASATATTTVTDSPTTLSIPTKQYWKVLRKAYFKSKGGTDTKYDKFIREYLEEDGPCGAQIKFEIRETPEKGRGVFALQPIPRNTIVWTTDLCGRFLSQEQFTSFLRLLPHHMQHDVMVWAYVMKETEPLEDVPDGNKDSANEDDTPKQRIIHRVYLDLDAGSLINHGGTDMTEYEGWKTHEQDNVVEVTRRQYLEMKKEAAEERKAKMVNGDGDDDSTSGSSSSSSDDEDDEDDEYIIAKVDIKVGDELLTDYTAFHDYRECDQSTNGECKWFDDMYDRVVEHQQYY